VQSADGLTFGMAERFDELANSLALDVGDGPEALSNALFGSAEIALATGPLAVRKISEMAH
jgi:hypothetical protein